MENQVFGRYRITGELGRGAMGIVYRAEDTVIGRTVAIKTIRLDAFPDPAERARLRDRLMREARSAGVLSHRNIVTVFDAGEENGVAFIAMEYVPGESLEQALPGGGTLGRERIVSTIAQVAEALDYAHGQGVVHRDIKPGNLMLTHDVSVKIADFGVAKMLSHQATQSDLMLGTPNYMAPEQIESRNVDGRTDQFALAVICYELLTGERPFHAESLAGLFLKILREDPPAPHLLNPSLDKRVDAVLARSLAKQAAERYPTCAAMARALSEALTASGEWEPVGRAGAASMATVAGTVSAGVVLANAETVVVEPPRFTMTAAVPARRGPGWKVAAALAVLGALGASAYLYMRERTPTALPANRAESSEPKTTGAAEPRPSPLAEPPAASSSPAVPVSTTTSPAKPASGAAGPVSGMVEIESNPPGATVRIDATRDQCKTPCSMELSQGRHVLHFTLAAHRKGTLVVTVPLESLASIRLDPLIGTLLVQSTPAGAKILLNGQAANGGAVTPATLRLTPGKYRLTLRIDGRRDYTQDVEVRDEAITQVEYNWP